MPKQDPDPPFTGPEPVELRGQMRKTHSGDCSAGLTRIIHDRYPRPKKEALRGLG
jgi:hypothetical protein